MVVGRRRWWGPILGVLLAACTSIPPAADAPSPVTSPAASAVWGVDTPAWAGFDPSQLAAGLEALRGTGDPVHEIVIARHRTVVLDATAYPDDGTTPHQVGGIAGTVLATLLGIAVDRGLVALDAPVLSFFPDRVIADRDAQKERMTLRDVLTLTTGLACGASDVDATIAAMTASDDPVGVLLDLPMSADPGTVFRACYPVDHLLSAVLQKTTGVSALEFARQFLFDPLGITDVRWSVDAMGYQRGWDDLYLRPADLARIGQLWLDQGTWGGKQVVSAAWVAAASRVSVATGGPDRYGLGWWLPQVAPGTVEAVGHGGQLLLVRPDLDVVVAVAAGGIDAEAAIDPLVAALVSPASPLLSDATGEIALARALDALRNGPPATTTASPRSTVKAVTGVTWDLEANPVGLRSVRLELKRSDAEGRVELGFVDHHLDGAMPLGLDGRYRLGVDDERRPVAIRGAWDDDETFVLEVDEVGAGHAFLLALRFDTDARTVAVDGREAAHPTGFDVTGVAAD